MVAFENILKWRERDKDQEQVSHRSGDARAEAVARGGTDANARSRAPGRNSRLHPGNGNAGRSRRIFRGWTPAERGHASHRHAGFINLPERSRTTFHVPLLFRYRGEVIPSFALQAMLLWLRVTPAEVKVDLGSSHCPCRRAGKFRFGRTAQFSSIRTAAKKARRMTSERSARWPRNTREQEWNDHGDSKISAIRSCWRAHRQIRFRRRMFSPQRSRRFKRTLTSIESVGFSIAVILLLTARRRKLHRCLQSTSGAGRDRIHRGVLPGGARHCFAMADLASRRSAAGRGLADCFAQSAFRGETTAFVRGHRHPLIA